MSKQFVVVKSLISDLSKSSGESNVAKMLKKIESFSYFKYEYLHRLMNKSKKIIQRTILTKLQEFVKVERKYPAKFNGN